VYACGIRFAFALRDCRSNLLQHVCFKLIAGVSGRARRGGGGGAEDERTSAALDRKERKEQRLFSSARMVSCLLNHTKCNLGGSAGGSR
jgi:hypothetical protein